MALTIPHSTRWQPVSAPMVCIGTARAGFQTQTYQGANYWVDVVFAPALGPDVTAPSVIASTPSANATNVATTTTVTATFSEPVNQATVDATNITLRNAGNALVASTVAYNNGIATLTPSAATFKRRQLHGDGEGRRQRRHGRRGQPPRH